MLIIFDCDGVLVDSEALAAEVFSAQLRAYDVPLSAEDCERRFRGHTLPYCFAALNHDFPDKLPLDFPARLAQATRDAFSRNLQAIAGVEAVLQWLRTQGEAFCVASNGAAGKIQHSLALTGLLPYFDGHCFSADAVDQGKPAPDLFLHAAQQMGFAAAEAVVVEDSCAGVTAALAAGMHVCLYQARTETPWRNGVSCFTRMSELPALLLALKQRASTRRQPT